MRRVASLLVMGSLALVSPIVAAGATPAEYRAQAASICKGTSAKLAKVKAPASASGVGRFLKQVLPIFRGQHTALERLSPPKALLFLHTKALGLEARQIGGIEALIEQIEDGADPAKAFKATDAVLAEVGTAESATWRKLRIPACASL
jgi:hypothetical protein